MLFVRISCGPETLINYRYLPTCIVEIDISSENITSSNSSLVGMLAIYTDVQ